MKTTIPLILTALATGAIFAAEPVVKTVPWVATNPLIPHDTYSGKTIKLKATTDAAGANYHWDFGDGSPVVSGTVPGSGILEASHAYTGPTGTVFTARITVEKPGPPTERASKPYFVRMEDKTLEVEVNVAIDEGLWFLFKSASRNGSQFRWQNGPSGGHGYWCNSTGSAVQAFQVHGHHEDQASNPYAKAVSGGLEYLFTTLYAQSMSLQGGADPDTNGNGIGLSVTGNRAIYELGAVMDALVSSGTPDALAPTGPTNVIGRRYQDLVQDMVDMYAWGQSEWGHYTGGWRYSWNGDSDNSAAQWGAIGMAAAERTPAHLDPGGGVVDYWATVPQWVKARNLGWLERTYHSNGYFGYTSTGPNRAVSTGPCGMVQLAFDGIPVTDPKWVACENYLRANWNYFISLSRDTRHYSYYAFTKAMRLALPSPVTMLAGNLDWYGDPNVGLARILVDRQRNGGDWAYDGWPYVGERTAAAWNLIILSPTVFNPGSPVAVAVANPNPAVAGQTIQLDGTQSYHTDPNKEIVQWEWDLDDDGIFDVSGPFTSVSFPGVGTYPVTLRVTDDGGANAQTATSVIQVLVNTPPVAPTADANGPYVFCPEAKPWFLDGTGSVNPDEGGFDPNVIPSPPGDTIQTYAWELDGDNDFDDAFGPTPDVTAFFTNAGPGDYLVQLRVTDTTATSYPLSRFPDLTSQPPASAEVHVARPGECVRITDLAARAKTAKVQLTWTDMGADHYNVYRGTTQGGPYARIGQTNSRYSTYLDETAVDDTTYYYVVKPADFPDEELSQSTEASATPVPRWRRR